MYYLFKKMQVVDISGEWMYMFSGRLPQLEEDVYMFSRTVRISEITAMEVSYDLFTIKLFVKGLDPFVFLSFQENHSELKPTVQKLVSALGMNPVHFNLQ